MRIHERFIRAADFSGVLGIGFAGLALADQLLGLDLVPGGRAMPVFLACFFGAIAALVLARCVQIAGLVLLAPRVESLRAGAGSEPASGVDVTPAA